MKKITFLVTICWLLLVMVALFWSLSKDKKEHERLAWENARSFFRQIVLDRAWNADHGGVYVPVTETTRPNPYLKDPLRDLETTSGVKLTKINPSFMTRQIAEIAARENGVLFHITSLNPIRPGNRPLAWEAEWLKSFERGAKEQGRFVQESPTPVFRYMAPLITKASCLPCHGAHGYKEGDIRGGISVTLPVPSDSDRMSFVIGYSVAALVGTLIILISGHLLMRSREMLLLANRRLSEEVETRRNAETEQKKLVASLREAMSEINTLQGIIPICSYCKQIRDDRGSWKKIEEYISSRSDARFSHGVCPECAKKYYADYLG